MEGSRGEIGGGREWRGVEGRLEGGERSNRTRIRGRPQGHDQCKHLGTPECPFLQTRRHIGHTSVLLLQADTCTGRWCHHRRKRWSRGRGSHTAGIPGHLVG